MSARRGRKRRRSSQQARRDGTTDASSLLSKYALHHKSGDANVEYSVPTKRRKCSPQSRSLRDSLLQHEPTSAQLSSSPVSCSLLSCTQTDNRNKVSIEKCLEE